MFAAVCMGVGALLPLPYSLRDYNAARKCEVELSEAKAQADGYKKDAQATDALSKACVKELNECKGDLFICQDSLALCEERKP